MKSSVALMRGISEKNYIRSRNFSVIYTLKHMLNVICHVTNIARNDISDKIKNRYT